jgi:exosortase A
MTIAMPQALFDAVKTSGNGRVWRRHLIALGIVAALILVIFRGDVATLTDIWWTSTTFGHCLFIGPVIAWLVWARRKELAALTPAAWAPGLLIVAAGGFGWLLGDAASVAFARQLGLVMMVQGAVVTLLGANVARGLLFPLAYAFFLVPFGEGLETPLQNVTVAMIMPMLHAVGVPAAVDGVLITIPNGYFEVAEACSGAKFVIAMIAYGALVANVCFRSWPRRAVFMAVALIVPVFANGIRAFGTIYAAHLTSVAAATGYDHIVYGWIFFGLVMAAVLAIGWRWFDRAPDDPVFDPAALQAQSWGRVDLWIGAALALTVASVFPAWSAAIASRAQALPDSIALPDVSGWSRQPMSVRAPWGPNYPGADHYLIGRYGNGPDAVDLAIAVYGSQHEDKEVISFGVGVLRQDDVWVRVEDLPPLAGGSGMRITAPGPVEREVFTWYRVGDTLTASPERVKIEELRARLLGGPQRAVAIHISAEVPPNGDARPAIERFLAALGPLDRLADHAAGMK